MQQITAAIEKTRVRKTDVSCHRQMLAQNPQRMDYYRKYQDIIADYNREKDRVTMEETFSRLVDLAAGMDAAPKQAAEEGLSQDEYALFQMLFKDNITKADRERLKQAGRSLLTALVAHLRPMPNWTKTTQTQADVKMFILDTLNKPMNPLTQKRRKAPSSPAFQTAIKTPHQLRRAIARLSPSSPITNRFSAKWRKLGARGNGQQERKVVWYQTQHQHWLGWLGEYSGPGAYERKDFQRSAEYAYSSPAMPASAAWTPW